jgi:hypothetical protein
MKDSKPNTSTQSHIKPTNQPTKYTRSQHGSSNQQSRSVRASRNPLGLQTHTTTPKKNQKTHPSREPTDNGRMAIPEPHVLHNTHQPGPRYPPNPPLRTRTSPIENHTNNPPQTNRHYRMHNRKQKTIKIYDIYKHTDTNAPSAESLAKFIHINNKQHSPIINPERAPTRQGK